MKKSSASDNAMGQDVESLTDYEMDCITRVFRSFETGLRQATILPKDLLDAMKMLGLNPMEQEIIDLTNNNVKNGYIYFPEFCNIIHKKYREESEDVFYQDMFKILCGTDPFPVKYKAKKYKLHDHFLSKENFHQMMTNLPEYVSEDEVNMMFAFADQDGDGKLSFGEFLKVMNPPRMDQNKNENISEKNEIVEIVNEEENADVEDEKEEEVEEIVKPEKTDREEVKTVKFTDTFCEEKEDEQDTQDVVEKKDE